MHNNTEHQTLALSFIFFDHPQSIMAFNIVVCQARLRQYYPYRDNVANK